MLYRDYIVVVKLLNPLCFNIFSVVFCIVVVVMV